MEQRHNGNYVGHIEIPEEHMYTLSSVLLYGLSVNYKTKAHGMLIPRCRYPYATGGRRLSLRIWNISKDKRSQHSNAKLCVNSTWCRHLVVVDKTTYLNVQYHGIRRLLLNTDRQVYF